jgi:Tol biopolymer transport system component
MAVSSFEPDVAPYSDEIGLININGSAVYRVAHHYSLKADYEAEVIPSISPDGTRVIFASNWGSSTGRPVQVYVADLTSACTRSP